jgi:hypothetical protein
MVLSAPEPPPLPTPQPLLPPELPPKAWPQQGGWRQGHHGPSPTPSLSFLSLLSLTTVASTCAAAGSAQLVAGFTWGSKICMESRWISVLPCQIRWRGGVSGYYFPIEPAPPASEMADNEPDLCSLETGPAPSTSDPASSYLAVLTGDK